MPTVIALLLPVAVLLLAFACMPYPGLPQQPSPWYARTLLPILAAMLAFAVMVLIFVRGAG